MILCQNYFLCCWRVYTCTSGLLLRIRVFSWLSDFSFIIETKFHIDVPKKHSLPKRNMTDCYWLSIKSRLAEDLSIHSHIRNVWFALKRSNMKKDTTEWVWIVLLTMFAISVYTSHRLQWKCVFFKSKIGI